MTVFTLPRQDYLEEALRQLAVHDLIRIRHLARRGEQAAQQRIHPALLHQPPRREKRAVQRQVALGNRGQIGVESAENRLDEGVPEAEGRRGKHVGDGGVQAGVVGSIIVQAMADDVTQPVLVGDVLHFSPDNLTGFLRNKFLSEIQQFSLLCSLQHENFLPAKINYKNSY
jgi:hypothetical protein